MEFINKHTGKTFESEVMVTGDGIELIKSPILSPISVDETKEEPVTEKPKRKKAVK